MRIYFEILFHCTKEKKEENPTWNDNNCQIDLTYRIGAVAFYVVKQITGFEWVTNHFRALWILR